MVFRWVNYGRLVPEPFMVIIFWVEIPFFYVLLELLLYEATREAYEYNNDVRHKCGMIILFTTTATITAVCVVVVDNSICYSDVTIGTTASN